jgi:hypothetical protein
MLSRSIKTGLFENVENDMTIYTRLGAPIEITEAEVRRRWWVMKRGRSEIFDKKPTDAQLRGAKETNEFDIWWIKAKQTGAYPDGSGAHLIGQFLNAPEDVTKRGFLDETFFRADDGLAEIRAACEAAQIKKAA